MRGILRRLLKLVDERFVEGVATLAFGLLLDFTFRPIFTDLVTVAFLQVTAGAVVIVGLATISKAVWRVSANRLAEKMHVVSEKRVHDRTCEVEMSAVRGIRWKSAWGFLFIGILLVSLAGWGFWYYVSPDLKRSPSFFNDIVIGTSRSVYVLPMHCEFSLYTFNTALDIYCGQINIEGTGTFYLIVAVPFGIELVERKGGKATWSVPINASYYSVAIAELHISQSHEPVDANVRLILKDSFVQGRRGNYQVTIPFGFRLPEDLREELSRRYEGYASTVGGLFDISLDLPSEAEITRVYPPDYTPGLTVALKRLMWTTTRLTPIFVSYSIGAEVTSYQVALFGSGLLFGAALSMITSSLRDIVTMLGIRGLEQDVRKREADSGDSV